MGLYNDRIVFKVKSEKDLTWPQPIRLSTFLRIEFAKEDARPDRFGFKLFLDDNVLADIGGPLKMDKEQNMANISISGEGLPLKPGQIGFSLVLSHGQATLFSQEVKAALLVKTESAGA